MALIDKLNAIGDAIRLKTGKTAKLTLDEMPNEIANIETGGTTPVNPSIEPLEITENGTYSAPNGVDGYSPVTVNVPIPDGYIKPSGTKEITMNGTHDVTEYASVVVSVPSSGGGGGDSEADVAGLLSNTLTNLNNSLATSVLTRACQGRTKIQAVNLPNVTSIGQYGFYGCSGIVTAYFSKTTSIGGQAFYNCAKLKYIDLGTASSIAAQAFHVCNALETLILRRTDSICTLSNTTALTNSGIGKGTGYIYVPSALIDSYKTASNWSDFADQIRAIEDYPDICG